MAWPAAFANATAIVVAMTCGVAAAQLRDFVKIDATRIVLEHVEVIDGTGAAAMADRNVVIERGKIVAITAGADEPGGLDLRGHAVMPGIVGMHDHLFAFVRPPSGPALFHQMTYSAPRLYLANGVTTIRTAGSVEPSTDLRLRQAIDAGAVPGPHIVVTGPYLEGAGSIRNLAMQQLTGADDARETVAYWAVRGVPWFKAYKDITRDELRAAIAEAHKRGAKVTGHLCSVTYREAAESGIDNLEHGFFVNTELDPDKKPDVCSASDGDETLAKLTPAQASDLIATLIRRHVAVTSTLPSTAAAAGAMPPLRADELQAMSPSLRDAIRPPGASAPQSALLLRKEMELERAFVAGGGLLVAGPDAVGGGGLVPGFADQREIELLVDAGFTAVEAIRIATLNGATLLGRADAVGSIAAGKNADLLVVKGDPAARIADIENVALVFKDGVGYDSAKLLDSVKGRYGEY